MIGLREYLLKKEEIKKEREEERKDGEREVDLFCLQF